jgi:hypothetical protein
MAGTSINCHSRLVVTWRLRSPVLDYVRAWS